MSMNPSAKSTHPDVQITIDYDGATVQAYATWRQGRQKRSAPPPLTEAQSVAADRAALALLEAAPGELTRTGTGEGYTYRRTGSQGVTV
jgi:hypothetical protein